MHPSLIAGKGHTEFAFESSNLKVEAILITIKDSDPSLAGLLVGRVCSNKMSIRCLVGLYFGPFYPDIAFNQITDFLVDVCTEKASRASSSNT